MNADALSCLAAVDEAPPILNTGADAGAAFCSGVDEAAALPKPLKGVDWDVWVGGLLNKDDEKLFDAGAGVSVGLVNMDVPSPEDAGLDVSAALVKLNMLEAEDDTGASLCDAGVEAPFSLGYDTSSAGFGVPNPPKAGA